MTSTQDTQDTQDTEAAVDRFLAGVEAGVLSEDLYAPDATLDATVPGWRFQAHGPEAIVTEYARWFTGPCQVRVVERHPLPAGELVRYVQHYDLGPASVTTHHLHLLTVENGRVARDVVFCGGRWGPDAVAQMGPAAHAG